MRKFSDQTLKSEGVMGRTIDNNSNCDGYDDDKILCLL